MAKKKASSIQASFDKLNELVERLEQEDLEIEEAMTTFEAGLKELRTLKDSLQKAEQKVQTLLEENGQPTLADFDEDITE